MDPSEAEIRRKEIKRERSRQYYAANRDRLRQKKADERAADPVKAKADAAAWYQANKERINEPKRRANFEAIERARERKAKAKGVPFVPREYQVYTTDDHRISERTRELAKMACKRMPDYE